MTAEHKFRIPTGDGHIIYGKLNMAEAEPSKKAVVFAHGLTGHMHQHKYQTGRRYFNERGYDVIRFAFYTDEEKARRLPECTLAVHAADLAQVLKHFAAQYELYLVGHSYGGLTSIIANPRNVKAISLWDPSVNPYEAVWRQGARYDAVRDVYILPWRVDVTVGKDMYEESRAYPLEKTCELAGKMAAPVQLALADGPGPNRAAINESLKAPKDIHSVKAANHTID